MCCAFVSFGFFSITPSMYCECLPPLILKFKPNYDASGYIRKRYVVVRN